MHPPINPLHLRPYLRPSNKIAHELAMNEQNANILSQLAAREPIFHRWEHLHHPPTRTDFESLTAPDFFEIGASGRIYTRDHVLETLETRYTDPSYIDDPWETSDFTLRQLSPETYLITYTLIQHLTTHRRISRRTTIWQQTPSGWQILFHQGTIIQPE